MLESDPEEYLKAVPVRTTENSSIVSKQFMTEVAQGVERIFTEFKHEVLNFSEV